MHSIRIDKNFFSNNEHDFPEIISFASIEEAEKKALFYQAELQKIANGTFHIEWITNEDHIHLNLSPTKRPELHIHKELIFSIQDESALAEFWDYFTNENFEFRLHGSLENIIHMFYGIAAFRMKRTLPCTVKVQESNHAFALCMGDVKGFPVECVRRLINRNANYKELVKEDEFVFFVPKTTSPSSGDIFIPVKEDSKTISFKDYNNQTLHIFSFLEVDEIDELIELMSEFNSMILILGSSEFDASEASLLVQKLKSMGKILIGSHESYNIGVHIDSMARNIEEHFERFLASSSGMSDLCNAFNHDLTTWVKKLFFEGTPSLHFLDDSLMSSCLTICQMLQPESESDAINLDDIFDF